jgi:hypothetical protein
LIKLINTHFRNYIHFLKEPDPNPNHQKITTKKKWQTLLIFIFIDVLLVIPSVLLILLIQEVSNLDLDNHAVSDLANDFGLIALILLGGVLSPFIEEIIFRLPLNYKRNYLFKLIGLAIGRETIKKYWFKHYSAFFYFFIVLFGSVHIFNYKDQALEILLLSPILILPQIIGGTVMAYLRMNLGFFWGFLQHAIFNSALMILAFYSNLEEKVMIDNEDFKLKIEVAENRFGEEVKIEINKDFDFMTDIEIEYAKYNQVAKQMDWDTINQKQNYKHFNIHFKLKTLEIDGDSVLHHHLLQIIEDQ